MSSVGALTSGADAVRATTKMHPAPMSFSSCNYLDVMPLDGPRLKFARRPETSPDSDDTYRQRTIRLTLIAA